jgi:hypothetical protein
MPFLGSFLKGIPPDVPITQARPIQAHDREHEMGVIGVKANPSWSTAGAFMLTIVDTKWVLCV